MRWNSTATAPPTVGVMSFSHFQPETVDEQMFLTAAMENKLPVVDKYLTDGGNPDVVDHVSDRLCWDKHGVKTGGDE